MINNNEFKFTTDNKAWTDNERTWVLYSELERGLILLCPETIETPIYTGLYDNHE